MCFWVLGDSGHMGKVENSIWVPSDEYLVYWLMQTMAISISFMGLAGQALFSFRNLGSLETIAGLEESLNSGQKTGPQKRLCFKFPWKEDVELEDSWQGHLSVYWVPDGSSLFFLIFKEYIGNVTLCPLNRI